MKAIELRIGNYYSQFGNETKISWVSLKELERAPEGQLWCKPIPLTEEWLLKFGWVWNEECNSFEKYPNGDARMHLTFKAVSGSYTMFNYVLKALIAERIFYVHQLQNLYQALTGEELTLSK